MTPAPPPISTPAEAFAEQARIERAITLAVERAATELFAEVRMLAARDRAFLSPALVIETWQRLLRAALAAATIFPADDALGPDEIVAYVMEEPALTSFGQEVYVAANAVVETAEREGWTPRELDRALADTLALDAEVPEAAPLALDGDELTAAGLRLRGASWAGKLGVAVRSAVTGVQGMVASARFVASAINPQPATPPRGRGSSDSPQFAPTRAAASFKKWVTRRDDRVRDMHAAVDGAVVPAEEMFIVGGYPMAFPGDRTAPPSLTKNCRCTVLFISNPLG